MAQTRGGPPLFAFEAAAGAPLVSILRFGPDLAASGGLPGAHSHTTWRSPTSSGTVDRYAWATGSGS